MQEGERVYIDINQIITDRNNNKGQPKANESYYGSDIMKIQPREESTSRYVFEPRSGKELSEGVEFGNNDYVGDEV